MGLDGRSLFERMRNSARRAMMLSDLDMVAGVELAAFERQNVDVAAVFEFDTERLAVGCVPLGHKRIDACNGAGNLHVVNLHIEVLIGDMLLGLVFALPVKMSA